MKILSIAEANLRRIGRDRTALVLTLVLPLVLILFIGQATQRFETAPLGLFVGTDGPLAAELADRLEALEGVQVERYDSEEALRGGVRRGAVLAGVIVPEGYDERLGSGDRVGVSFVAEPRSFPAGLRTAVDAAVADHATELHAARFTALRYGGTVEAHLAEARELAASTEPVDVAVETVGGGRSVSFGTGFDYQAPANLTLFVFITSLATAAQVVETRRLGVTRRMLGTPTRAGTILAGEALGRFAIALLQGLFILVAGALVFGVDFGDPVGAGALLLLFVLVGTGAGMLAGAALRTPEQAQAVGVPVGIALGMLGGCMWPLAIVPETMQTVGHLFPHAWAMDAWVRLTAFGDGLGGILPQLGVLAGFAAVLLATATWRLRRAIVRP